MARGKRGRVKGGAADLDDGETILDRIERALDRWPAGLHELGGPARDLPLSWPVALIDVYMTFDGLRLFNEAIELVPSVEVERDEASGRWRIGTAWGDELWVDREGQVWRLEDDAGELVLDGTSPGRWLHGAIDAEAMLYDSDGEFAEEAFDEAGELNPEIELGQLRAQIKRDARAPGPRWRLGRLMARRGDTASARVELEQVVADAPAMAWAWLDLARISEQLGELDGAIEEAATAGEVGGDQAAFFWSHAARLAAHKGDEPRRAELAIRARDADPRVVEELTAGAAENLGDGDLVAAATMIALARALAPRDLAVLDLARRIDDATKPPEPE